MCLSKSRRLLTRTLHQLITFAAHLCLVLVFGASRVGDICEYSSALLHHLAGLRHWLMFSRHITLPWISHPLRSGRKFDVHVVRTPNQSGSVIYILIIIYIKVNVTHKSWSRKPTRRHRNHNYNGEKVGEKWVGWRQQLHRTVSHIKWVRRGSRFNDLILVSSRPFMPCGHLERHWRGECLSNLWIQLIRIDWELYDNALCCVL